MDTAGFLHALFDGKPDGALIVLWTLPNKRSACFRSADDAAGWCRHLPGYDIYVHVGLSSRELRPTERLKAGQVAGIVGLWADIDVAGPGHRAARRYPPDLAAALDLITALPRAPSLLVDSGHGLHAWWLVDGGPWMFADGAERAHAARVASGWQLLLQAEAGHRGWDIDSTADLARVLRVPGTMNRKVPDAPVEVRVL